MDTMLATGFRHPFLSKRGRTCVAGSGALLMALSSTAWAQGAEAVAAVPAVASAEAMASLLGRIAPAALAAAPAPRVSVEQSQLTDDQRAGFGRNGFDAYGRPVAELHGVTYRWWTTRGAANFGVGFGTTGTLSSPPDATGAQQFAPTPGGSLLSFGMRYQVDNQATLFADATGARRFNADIVDRYSTKVGLEWKGRSNKFGLDGASRSLALQLDSGYRMSLRVRKNGAALYLKGQF